MATADTAPDGVRPAPVFGDCRDVFGHGDDCGGTVGDAEPVRDELGTHEYTLLVNGFPGSMVADGGFPGLLRSSDAITRSPPPSGAAGQPETPYELIVHGWAFEIEAVHQLTAVDWHATCEVSAACRDRWCAAFEQTVADLRDRRDALDRAVELANARLATRTFSMPGVTTTTEHAALPSLRGRLGVEVRHQIARIREDYERFVAERRAEARASGDRVDLDEARLCAACRGCDPRFPPYDDVLAWELRWSERVDSTATWLSEGRDPAEGWSRHAVTGRALLERVDPVAGIELGEMGGFGGILEGLLRFLMGVMVFLAELSGNRQLFWEATEVDVSGWRGDGYQITSETDGSVFRSFAVVEGERTEPPGDGDLRLMIEPGAGEYELSLADVEATGVATTTTGRSSSSAPTSSFVGSWELIQRLVAGRESPGFDDVPDADPDAMDASATRWSVPEPGGCGLEVHFAGAAELDGEAVDPFVMVSANGPEGTAAIDWSLVPHTLRRDAPRRVDC